MILKTVLVNGDNREDLKKALCEITPMINADFSGDNGEEYTSEEALEKGYNCDLDMYFDKYSQLSDDYNFVESIINIMCHGSQYEYDIVYQDGHVKAISIAIEWDV